MIIGAGAGDTLGDCALRPDLYRPTDALGRGDAGCGQSGVPRSSGVRGYAVS